jgi:hypothetical protein
MVNCAREFLGSVYHNDERTVTIFISNMVHLMEIFREALCFCAGGELHASLVTCNVMLLATVPHVFGQDSVNEHEDKLCNSFYVNYNSPKGKRFY